MTVNFRDIKRNGMVDIWDLGPARPKAPVPPPEPKKTGSGGDQALDRVEYEDAVADYEKELRTYSAAKKEHDHHRLNIGGPVKVELWPVQANHAVHSFPDRYVMSLPKGAKPGKAQVEADEAARIAADEQERLKQNDPQFGTKGAQQS